MIALPDGQQNKKQQMNKLIDTENRMAVSRGKEGWGGDEEGQGGQIHGDRRQGTPWLLQMLHHE